MFFKLIAINGRFIHSCLALFYLRTALAQNIENCEIKIIQYTINSPYYRTLREIGAEKPDAIFFSVYIWSSIYIKRLIRDLIKFSPQSRIILGGPQAEALTQELDQEVLKYCTVVTGEIEGLDQHFYQDLSRSNLLSKYSCSKTSSFKMSYRQEDFATHLNNRNIYYESSRGCPFGCTYCLSALEKGVRHLPFSQVCAEIGEILRHKPKVIRLVDRTFNDLPERALAIWRFLQKQPGETLFHFEMAPDRFTEEMFHFLEQLSPGRFQFELGIQSTNQQTLMAINRNCDWTKICTSIKRLVALDTIHIHLDLILGLPHENRESFATSFSDVFKLGPHYIQMGLLKVLPNTPLSNFRQEYDLVVCEDPPYEILANRWLNAEELAELYWFGECFESFYNNRFFRSFWAYLREHDEDIFAFFQKLLTFCRGKDFFDLSPTQELLSSLLFECSNDHSNGELLRELLVFDWLRCGHRFLPQHLEGRTTLAEHRKNLWHKMDLLCEGVYDYRSRDEFFKQGIFYQFSGKLLQEVGLAANGKPGHICFLPSREMKVFRLAKVMLIAGYSENNQTALYEK